MGQYDRTDRNEFGRRSDNRFDRYATERASSDRFSPDRYNDRDRDTRLTGDWRDDERRSRGERDNDRGFFERAADEVTSWFSGSDDRDNDRRTDAERERERYYERRFNTEGARGAAGRERDYNSTFDTRYGQNLEEDRLSHTARDDDWRRDYNNRATWRGDDIRDGHRQTTPSSWNTPERFGRDQADGREAGRDYYNRLNQDLRSGGTSYNRDHFTHNTPYASNNTPYAAQNTPYASQGGSSYGSYGRTGGSSDASRYGSSNYGSSYNTGSGWSNQSGTYGDNSGSYGSASRGQFAGKGPKGWRRSDDRVKEDVCEYLERNAMIDASDVDITVAEGVVTLTGTVPDRQMKRMCEDEIEHLPGVKDVNNQLRVNRESSSSDSSSSRTSSSSNTNYGSSNSSTMGTDGASNSGMSAGSSSNGNGSSSGTSRTDGTTGSTKKSGASVS